MSEQVLTTTARNRHIDSGEKTYHTNPNCPRLKGSAHEPPADSLGEEWTECEWCAEEVVIGGRNKRLESTPAAETRQETSATTSSGCDG